MRLDLIPGDVLVTGAARGIGAAIVGGALAAGARVLALDIDAAGLDELARIHPGGALETASLDLADRGAVEALCADRGIGVLIHAAGGVRGQRPKPLEEVEDDEWQAIFDANVTGALNLARALAPGMKARGEGRIVTITSGAGLRPSLTGIQAYCASKHALVGLTRQLALEFGPHGITVNSVAPGFLRTSPDYERQWEGYGPEGQRRLVEGIALRRLGTAEDIAHACLFLASRQAGFITGQVLPVTGHPFP
ncbi:3-oxoacyl-[acyl-carrier protein] reductase [Palleronia aestuarii]|uniref:3-oxoacyl-[acyl-carrier protein] reductase n=2 Tax=Palleronia aestuarii TaxID=568105 RepID=A0A2W7NUM7_9RHOB|nr:3-oxoacyl-[acyl-carrier protein] reductase [Palleronia aestuarii]